jgi:DNA polymerase IV
MQRKIIHIDMDAFFAAIEQRDNPSLKGKPVVVGGKPGSRGVVATASYEARKFGIRSAMSSSKAFALCPDALFIQPRFEAYREASRIIHEIFRHYTDKIEALSLDEAYLDVTYALDNNTNATDVAKDIRMKIFQRTSLTASAGVSINKLVAKIASDYHKPDGITVVPPEKVLDFLSQMSVRKIPGVGPVMEDKLLSLRISKIKHLQEYSAQDLVSVFGKFGTYLHYASFGIDEREVSPYRERKSLGMEDTFTKDLTDIEEMKDELKKIAGRVATRLQEKHLEARTVTLKITYVDFKKITRTKTLEKRTDSMEELFTTSSSILIEQELFTRPIRLLGISCSNFKDEELDQKLSLSCFQLSFKF